MALLNFLESKLLPKLINKPLCTEKYEAENLLSSSFHEKLRGFIGYPSVRPPIDLEFEFICSINIHYVTLKTTLGNHKCSGIELLVQKGTLPYVSIAKTFVNADKIYVCNSRKYSQNNLPPNCNSAIDGLFFFKGSTFKSFLDVDRLKIVIFRTERSVPCLGSVEVWGTPARSCSQTTKQTVYKLVESRPCEVVSEIADDNKFTIPEDFKDDLTCEIMTIPYTLPSGKTIDQTTLEKHIESEKSFGRKPGDPFTGLKFNKQLKPILNVALKSRIDMFLLKNSHQQETFNLKRTLRTANPKSKRVKVTENSENAEGLVTLMQQAKKEMKLITFSDVASVDKLCNCCKMLSEYLYELPCADLCCRNCLLSFCNADCTCGVCSRKFDRNSVKKIDF